VQNALSLKVFRHHG